MSTSGNRKCLQQQSNCYQMHWWQIHNAKWYIVINVVTQYKKEQHFFQIFWYFSAPLSQLGASHTWNQDRSKAQRWGLVQSQSRGACEEVNSMEQLSSYLILCHQSACPGPSCCPPLPALGEMVTFPVICSPLERAAEGTQCCPECCGEETQMDFRILTLWSSHHQGCGEGSHWITEGQSFP